jgi:hypothetical protein
MHDELYACLPHGRLVLIGKAGAGKTGAMILLLLAALDHRASQPEPGRGEVPVPVWLTLGGWNAADTSLATWAVATMYRDHPYLRAVDYGPDAAEQMLGTGQLALFLDGLDEMPLDLRGSVFDRIEREAAGLRIVLTSRADGYDEARRGGQLANTAVVEVQPVAPQAAADYLAQDQSGEQRDQWRKLGRYLQDNPSSVATQALDNPLILSLVRATYRNHDPMALVQFSAVPQLREHLMDRLCVTAYPDPRRRAHATRWLGWAAHQMGASRDLPWWHIPTWIPRHRLAITRVIVTGLVFVLVGLLVFGLVSGLVLGLTSGLVVGIKLKVRSWEPRALVLCWPNLGELRGMIRVFMIGLVGGLGAGLVVWVGGGLIGGVEVGLVGGLVLGLVLGLVAGLTFALTVGTTALVERWGSPRATATDASPISTYLNDRRFGLVIVLGSTLVVGLIVGLVNGLADGLVHGFIIGGRGNVRSSVLGSGLMFGLTVGLMSGGGLLPTVWLSELALLLHLDGRVRFMPLLEEALARQILRQAGTVYQFRHAELQGYLAGLYRTKYLLDRPKTSARIRHG